MVSRMQSPASYRFLEWGMKTSMPGSRVLDAQRRFVFTGSRVRSARGGSRFGEVVELISEEEVRVSWAGARFVTVDPRLLVVVDPFPG